MKAFALMQLKLYSSSILSRCFSWRLLQLMSLPRPGRDRTKEFWKEWTWDKATFLLKRFCVDGGWPWSDERWTQLPRVTANQDFFFLLLLLLPSNWNGSAPTRLKKDWVCNNNTWWKLFFPFSPFNRSFYFLLYFSPLSFSFFHFFFFLLLHLFLLLLPKRLRVHQQHLIETIFLSFSYQSFSFLSLSF